MDVEIGFWNKSCLFHGGTLKAAKEKLKWGLPELMQAEM